MKMHLVLILTLVLFLPVKSMWPSLYYDSAADSVYATEFVEDSMYKNVENKIMIKEASRFYRNPGSLGFPEPNVTDSEENPDESLNGAFHCAHGNVFLTYRRPLEHELDDETLTLNGNMFTTIAGRQGSLMGSYGKFEDSDLDENFLEQMETIIGKIKARTHRQTCWPSHGFHMHTSTNTPEDPPFHLGPMCDTNEYFDVTTHRCTSCGNGLSPDFASMLSLTKHDHIQTLIPSECEGVEMYLNRKIIPNLFPNATTIACQLLVNNLGWFAMTGGDGTSSNPVPAAVIDCIHKQCGASVDKIYETNPVTIGWNFRDLHVGKYHPFAPLECRGFNNIPSGVELRPECSLCSFADDICIRKSAVNVGSQDEPQHRCQREYAKTSFNGLHRINRYDYKYHMPDFSPDKQYIIHDENIVFEGPDMSQVMSMTLDELRHEYCFNMKADMTCKYLDDEPIILEETPALDNVTLYVSAGDLEEPFYNFYTDENCQGDQMSKYEGVHHLATNTEYTFRRCQNALTHPFYIEPVGDHLVASGITNTSSLLIITGGEGRIYEWKCTSHSQMRGKMIAVDDNSRRRLYTNAAVGMSAPSKTRSLSSPTDTFKSPKDLSYFELGETNLNVIALKPTPDIYKDEIDLVRKTSSVSARVLNTTNSTNNETQYVFDVNEAFSNEWTYGDLLGGSETFIGEYDKFSECYEDAVSSYPDANGVTYDIDRERCYVEFHSGARNENELYISRKIQTPDEVTSATIQYPKEWVFTQVSNVRLVSRSVLSNVNRSLDEYANSDMWSQIGPIVDQQILFEFGLFEPNKTDTAFGDLYTLKTRAELGSIVSWKWALEPLDSAEAMSGLEVTLNPRKVLTVGVNYEFDASTAENFGFANHPQNTTSYWSSLHVIEFSGSTSKSKCLQGYMNKGIKEIHGVAVIPFTLDDQVKQADKNEETLQVELVQDSKGVPEPILSGKINDFENKDDFGAILASVTKSDGSVSMWFTTYDGIPFEINEDTPGSRYVPFDKKWSKYAVHRGDAMRNYLKMAVVAEDQSVYVFDGEIEMTESFQIIRGQGILSAPCGPPGSCTETAVYKTVPESNEGESIIVEAIRDIKWTEDDQLLVATNYDVYLYKTKRSDRPLVVCQKQQRPHEIDPLVPPGTHWELTDKCDIQAYYCEPGTYQDEFGKQSCKQCEPGKYQPSSGKVDCFDCAIGRFQFFPGRTECRDCMPGFHSSKPGSPGLGPGEHDSIMLDFVCESCPIGKFSMEKNAVDCLKCKSDKYCDIRSQIFPHSECTPNSSDWLNKTDHIYEFCCSTFEYYEDNYDDATMRLESWRSAHKIHCIERYPIQVLNPPKFCGSLSDKISEVIGQSAESEILRKASDIDFDDVSNFNWDDIASMLASEIEYLLSYTGNQSRINSLSNYTVELIENVTLEHEACLINSTNATIDYVLSLTQEQDVPLPFGVIYKENTTEESTCMASLRVRSIQNDLNECCPNFADSSPELFNVDGTLNVNPGDDLYCLTIYSETDFDFSKYDSSNMTMTEYIEEEPLGCYVTKTLGGENFHPLRDEFFQCCPDAREDVLAEDWYLWDFRSTDLASVECYHSTETDDCYLQYTYFNESGVATFPTYEYIDALFETCAESDMEFVPTIMDVSTPEECIEGWNLTGYENQQIDYSTDVPCPEGWNETYGFEQYEAIYEGTCDDIGFVDVPWEECYEEPEIWKQLIDADLYDKVRYTAATYEPITCTVTTKIPIQDCQVISYGGGSEQVCTEMNLPLSEEEMDAQFEQQTCSSEFPCLCKRKTTCFKPVTECSGLNQCICSKEVEDCEYYPVYGDRDCRCMNPTTMPEPSEYIFRSAHNLTVEYKVTGFWTTQNYSYTSGVVQNMVIAKEKTWKNLTAADIPIGISTSSDNWNGFYTSDYFFNVRSYDVEEVLIDMKGGIDYESTRGTDEFRYCRHEYDVPKTETKDNMFETYINASNASNARLVNGTEVKSFDTEAVYCSSFFPIVRQTLDGRWTCSSVGECPYWEFWPRPINDYGFVETDPCLCAGHKEYNGYCIPDLEVLVPKVGDEFQSIQTQSESAINSMSVSNKGATVAVSTSAYVKTFNSDGTEKGTMKTAADVMSTVVSSNSMRMALHTSDSLKIYTFADEDWTIEEQISGTFLPRISTESPRTFLSISSDGKSVVAAFQDAVRVYERSESGWSQKGVDLPSSALAVHVRISHDGSTIAFALAGYARVYTWSGDWQTRGGSISLGNSVEQIGRVALSDDGQMIVVSIPSANIVKTYSWKSTRWVQKDIDTPADATQGLSVSSDKTVLATCGASSIDLYIFNVGQWRLIGSKSISVNGCAMSPDGSVLAYSTDDSMSVIATSLEADVFLEREAWVSDLDEYFKDSSYEKYNRPCGVGSVKKAIAEYDITNITWWEDAYDRACMCDTELCNGYEAHRIIVGLSQDLPSSQLLTMTCASDGCIYDQIDAERWTDSEDEFEDCTYARDEICGVYSFGRYNDQMQYEPLRGLYNEDGRVTSGVFKCPFTNGQKRNDFLFEALQADSIYVRDGDFDITPNGMPAYCGCKNELCDYNQYCMIELDRGFCGNTKREIRAKILEASILPQCTMLPKKIEVVNLGKYVAKDTCTCNEKFCEADSYCGENGCVECVCGEDEYELLEDEIFSTCMKLSNCQTGEYVSTVQTRSSDRECSLCELGVNYSPYPNTHTCVPCTECIGQVESLCTLTSDTVCGLPCLADEEEINGECVKRCNKYEHRNSAGTCLLCDYGTYFDGEQCQYCPDGHYTTRRGSNSQTRPIENICYPHVTCATTTHFWASSPSRSSAGRCQLRYSGNCAMRIVGNETTDDICQNYRDLVSESVAYLHAKEHNNTDEIKHVDSYMMQHLTSISTAKDVLETQNYVKREGINSRPNYDALRTVSRYLHENALSDTTEPYIDVSFGDDIMRVYTLFDSAAIELWNLQTPFEIDAPVNNVSFVFFTKQEDIQIEYGEWDCSDINNYMFWCIPKDVLPPVITMEGDAVIFMTTTENYEDQGATATDDRHGIITPWIVTESNVQEGQVGDYEVTYTVSDRAGNEAQIKRLVKIVDQ